MAVFGKAGLWAGLAAVLLAVQPGRAQDSCEDCHGEFPAIARGFADDLAPETGVFVRPIAVLRDRFVSSDLDRALALNEWSVRIVGVSADSDLPDFAVVLQYPPPGRGAMARIVGGSLAIPSYLYEFLFDARTPPHYDSMDFERRASAAQQMSLAEYGNTQPNPADDEEVARAKARINARLKSGAVRKCEVAIDNRLADRAQDIMSRTLARSHYSESSEMIYPTDPKMKTQYYPFTFHFQAGYEGIAGDTHLVGTKPALMVQATMAMRDFCQTSDRKYLAALSQALDGLEKKLPIKK